MLIILIEKQIKTMNIVIRALHMDPDIYPQPDLFDPYRFDDEIKKSRDGMVSLICRLVMDQEIVLV